MILSTVRSANHAQYGYDDSMSTYDSLTAARILNIWLKNVTTILDTGASSLGYVELDYYRSQVLYDKSLQRNLCRP